MMPEGDGYEDSLMLEARSRRQVQDTFPHLVPAIEPLCTTICQFRVGNVHEHSAHGAYCTPRRIRDTSSLK